VNTGTFAEENMCKEFVVHFINEVPKEYVLYPFDMKSEQIKKDFYIREGYMPLAIFRFTNPTGNWQFTAAEKRTKDDTTAVSL